MKFEFWESVGLVGLCTWLTHSAGAMPLGSTARDFEQPGTQPSSLTEPLVSSLTCGGCHGFYDEEVEPLTHWSGSMMAQSARDPIFHAGLAIAEQDVPFSGEFCIRCHAPGGWLAGRSDPPDGSALEGDDFDGVNCSACHRMVDPVASAENPEVDAAILAALLSPPSSFPHSGQMVMDPEDRRRGPFDLGEDFFWHEWEQSPYHRESLLCATCHDVTNPAFVREGGPVPATDDVYVLDELDEPHPTHDKLDGFPLERTFTEWALSEFAAGPVEMGGRFGGNKTAVSTCQDCHMPDATGVAADPAYDPVERDDLPLHIFVGANSWVPRSIGRLDSSLLLYDADEASGVDAAVFEDAILRSEALLASASDMDVSQVGSDLKVRITNESGHKLPTGYGEGKRMWLHVAFFDELGALVAEYGSYDEDTATLDAESTKVYEMHLGLDEAMAARTGHPAGTSFHMALSNKIVSDNRIPPRGFTQAAFEAGQAGPVGYSYADGQHWDDTVFSIPVGAVRAEVELFHQTTSREYIEFLRDENVTNDAGQIAYDEWVACGKSAPVEMVQASLNLDPVAREGLDVYLTDTEPNYLPGEDFSITINVENLGTRDTALTRADFFAVLRGIVDFSKPLYNGRPFEIEAGETFVYPFSLAIPPAAPLGFYEAGVEIYSGADLLDVDRFDFIMGELEECPSIVGQWTLDFEWEDGLATLSFFSDGTFSDGYEGGTWKQFGCGVAWTYDNGTRYWGTMDPEGGFMSGEMESYFGSTGAWTANRNSCASIVGEWTLDFEWDAKATLTFSADGTFFDGGTGGTWQQFGCVVEWTYENGTRYWGTMDSVGNFMRGEMDAQSGASGTWSATRECASIVGQWTLEYEWDDSITITFFSDGTFTTGRSNGTWKEQEGCGVEWTFESGTRYWGTMDGRGYFMSGEMESFAGKRGTWSAERNPCALVVGQWEIAYEWDGTSTITFLADGTFSVEGFTGTWEQFGCVVEWAYESGTRYWGAMDSDGDMMSGEMKSFSGSTGTWSANRSSNASVTESRALGGKR